MSIEELENTLLISRAYGDYVKIVELEKELRELFKKMINIPQARNTCKDKFRKNKNKFSIINQFVRKQLPDAKKYWWEENDWKKCGDPVVIYAVGEVVYLFRKKYIKIFMEYVDMIS